MNIFYEAGSKLDFLQELTKCVASGTLPACVTGLSAVHKAHAVLQLSIRQNVLVICDDEANAVRMVSDINEMAGSRAEI